MAKEFKFRSPGFFEREIDLTQRVQAPVGTPAGIVGTALKGPAFVPVTVGSFVDFETKFGSLDPKHFGPYAVDEFLRNRTAATYLRVLGAGANDTLTDIEKTRTKGQVRNAGFVVTGSAASGRSYHVGAVQFLVAAHDLQSNELLGMPMFSDNDSFGTGLASGSDVHLVRGVIFTAEDTRLFVMDGDANVSGDALELEDDVASLGTDTANGTFKLIISSSDTTFDQYQGHKGLRVLSASLNPSSQNYISKILNTDPVQFGTHKHLLYLDYAVDDEVAQVIHGEPAVAIASGSSDVSLTSGDTSMTFRDMFGHYDTRYKTPRTPWIISQPFGTTEYDLFYFESIDDGEYANTKFKVSIANVRKSVDPKNEWGTFTVQVREWDDTDQDPKIIEQFTNVTLNPKAENYVGRAVGDKKVYYNFDAESDDDKRLVIEGKFPNRSNVVRIRMNPALERGMLPETVLPFGFRGVPTIKTNDAGTSTPGDVPRLAYSGTLEVTPATQLSGAIVPPLPFRFKVTRGNTDSSNYAGSPGVAEIVDSRLYWGTKFERNVAPLNPNPEKEKNVLTKAYAKFQGIDKLDAVLTGTLLDEQNDNKFTLARVAFSNNVVAHVTTGTVNSHMLEAAYIRNATPNASNYRVSDGVITDRITLGTLAALTSSAEFNRYADFTKFTTMLYGGFDGVNILDKNAKRLNDKGASTDTGGGANSAFTPTGLAYNPAGEGRLNNAINSYREATRIMTDELTVNTNLLAIPGIRDTFITDYALQRARDFGLMMYIMDIVEYDNDGNRLFDDSSNKPNVEKTVELFETRALDNDYGSTYFPDINITDRVNNRRVTVPASVAALAALGFNDRVAYPWYAPAGFNRGALDFVHSLEVRIDGADRDTLYDARINPIARFPREGIAIFGQKTLKFARSALDRVNVRRLMLEIKRIVKDVAQRLVFEQNTTETRAKFVSQTSTLLALVQAQAGIEGYKVVMDDTNNTLADVEANKLNGRITVIPTRAIEFVALDFIITPSGVEFVE